MLKQFYAVNYRNLNFVQPLTFESITGIYGGCAAGKTNLCKAIGDIAEAQSIYNYNKKIIKFYYTFSYDNVDVELEYWRNKTGMIDYIRVTCESWNVELNLSTPYKEAGSCIGNLQRQLVLRGSILLSEMLEQTLREVNQMYLMVDEAFRVTAGMNNCTSDYKMNTGEDIQSTLSGKYSLIICDDAELQEDNMKFVTKHQIPCVYTSRKANAITEWCRGNGSYYVCSGNLFSVMESSRKDLRNKNQLNQFLNSL